MEGGSSTSHSQFLIKAPPQEEYPSDQAAEAAIHSWTKAQKFNVSRQKVERNDDGEICYRLFVCDQSGKPKNTRKIADADRKRPMRRTKRSGCPMRISIVAVDPHNPAGAWRVAHTRDGSYVHNHPGSDDIRVPVAHRQREARRLRATEATNTDIVDLQVMAGVSTSRIYATMLLSDKNILAIPKDIANAKAARRSNLIAHKTSDEALLDRLRDKGFNFSFDIDPESNRLLYVMWAHPATTKLARELMDHLIVDCTYKTNRSGMPLLSATILTGLNTILPFAQVWLPSETEPDFVWAFNKIKELMQEQSVPLPRVVFTDRDLACTNATETVFPESDKMLCHWYIRRNVLAHAKKKFGLLNDHNAAAGRKKTNNLDTDIFMAKFDERSSGLRAMNAAMGKYLDAQWWPHKAKYVRCWTDQYSHFGCRDTSTVEGAHATRKSWLDNSQGDLLMVLKV